jgi:hypothetical protein
MSDAPSFDTAAKRKGNPILIDLALQGGGAHGAFTWGVLDRLLEEPRLSIEGISGTSAGAMNAAVLAHGHAAGGFEGAKAALEDFWRRVSHAAKFSPFQRTPLDIMLGRWTLDTSPIFLALDLAARMFSPYDLNPRGANPMRDILTQCIDFARLAQSPIRLFVTATNVRTGRGRVFRNAELTLLVRMSELRQHAWNFLCLLSLHFCCTGGPFLAVACSQKSPFASPCVRTLTLFAQGGTECITSRCLQPRASPVRSRALGGSALPLRPKAPERPRWSASISSAREAIARPACVLE